MQDHIGYKIKWRIERYASEADYRKGPLLSASVFERNLLLNSGITALLNLLTGAAAAHFGNANAALAVGDSNTAAVATQTGLQAVTNKYYQAVEAGYPQISNQTITFRSVFGANDANFNWNELAIVNGATAGDVHLNRRVSNQGTKASGQVWTLDATITFS